MIDSVLKNKIYLLLVLIVFFASILRFYKIDQIPVSLYWDEVSSTYNAASILETGRDEFGNRLPLLFRAYEDYKTPANIYLTAIAVKIFGLNEFSARFTSAFLGTLTVLATFFLTIELIKKKFFNIKSEYIALLASFLIAISPWHIQFSRTGFEANSGLFFVVFGTFLFLKFINTNSFKYLTISMISFAASIYFYRSIWIFTPLFLTSLFVINYKNLFSKESIKKSVTAIALFITLILPFIPIMFSPQGKVRINQVVVTNNSQNQVYESAKKIEESGKMGKVIYNRRIVYALESAKGYLKHFSPSFLFFQGDGNLRHGVSGVGTLYAWAIIFIVPGLIALVKLDRKTAITILCWILIAPIPAAVSVPSPHSLRSLNMIPMPQLLIALGIIWTGVIVSKKYRILYAVFVGGLILIYLNNYLGLYFGEASKKSSSEWGDGYKQLASYVFQNENKYDKVLISGHYWQPYAYFLFFKKYDPRAFQATGSKSGFDKYVFGGTSWDRQGKELGDQNLEILAGTKNYLVALSPVEYELQKQNLLVVKEIKNHNNEVVFLVAKPK